MNSVKTIAVRNTPQEINLSNITHKEDVPTPLRQDIVSRLRYIEDLKFFLVTAPIKWMDGQVIRKYYLNEELGYISCIYWENLYYITGTDIIKILIFRFEKFGRHIINKKKFEEGIFSDLRNLKVDEHCILQLPRSPMLQFLHKNNCIKTQKKQKVFFWFSVVHDRLFADCLERDLKREMEIQKLYQTAKTKNQPINADKLNALTRSLTTKAVNEPSLSFKYDSNNGFKPRNEPLVENLDSGSTSKNKLYEQLVDYMQTLDMVKTPSVSNVKFNLDNDNNIDTIMVNANDKNAQNILSTDSPSTSKLNKNKEFASNKPVDQIKKVTKPKKRKNLNLSINVPDNNNVRLNRTALSNLAYSNDNSNSNSKSNNNINTDPDFPLNYFPVEVEYQDDINPQLNVNITSIYDMPSSKPKNLQNNNKKRKKNGSSANVEYSKFMEQLISPMGGYINPFQTQHPSGDKFLFNGTGFTPIRSAFPQDLQTASQNYSQNTFSNTMGNLDMNQWQYMNMVPMSIPPSTSVMPQMPTSYQPYMNNSWGFMNQPQQPSIQQQFYQQQNRMLNAQQYNSPNQNDEEQE